MMHHTILTIGSDFWNRARARVMADPAHHGRIAATAFVTLAVVYNAAFGQIANHAAPWFGGGGSAPVEESVERAARPIADPIVFGLQSELMDLGYYSGVIDGIVGSRTRKAVKAFERDNDLAVTGLPTEALLARIRMDGVRHLPRPTDLGRPSDRATGSIAPRTEAPAEEDSVMIVQRGLAASGVDIMVDGLMGPMTRGAIEAYQSSRGLSVTGEASGDVIEDMRSAGLL